MSTDYLLRAECFIFWNRHYGMTGLPSKMSQVEESMRLKTRRKKKQKNNGYQFNFYLSERFYNER